MEQTDKGYFGDRSADRWFYDSGLFQEGKERGPRPNAVLSILLFFCLWGGSLALGRLIATASIGSMPDSGPIWISFALSLRKILICGTQILVFFAWVRFVEKRRIVTMGFLCGHRAKAYWSGFLLGIGSVTVILSLLAVLGAVEIDLNRSFPPSVLAGTLCVAALGWMVQSASEEIGIRGWLIPTLGRRYPPWAAVLLTGAAFGAIHLLGNGATVLSFLNLTLSGFFFALYAISAGNIWGVCGLHFGWNLSLGQIYGSIISGEPSIDSSLLITSGKGADVLTGGTFGPEGGLVTTLFLACAILLIIILDRRKERTPPT